ncbi:hypothetical protein B0H03_10466 [Rathayibacter iranicus NCPPB 2253 = VKM Ac-1602]|uniref:Uncharacterized protein n=1 Tax=Rathayibacter iranicus NCPPB 2253 = VKM Ac-1602 TaxID=1328868 RepID=A0ABX5LGC4_9MICO|nr:hypothetical protein B0H03_10466 [Rathayibacter iranicus NCPPB 2253 = VKM Ac-1602]
MEAAVVGWACTVGFSHTWSEDVTGRESPLGCQASDRKWGDPGPGDAASWIGREFSPWHGVNPADPAFGAHVFGVETGGDAGLPVTKHDAVTGDSKDDRGYLDPDTESARNVSRALRGDDERLTPPTPFRETLPRPVPRRAPEAPAHG